MPLFWKKTASVDGAVGAPSQPPQLFLAAFGKHPGWDDHIDDIGLSTEALVEAKQILYVNGIGRQIDSGAWDALDETQRLAGFKHFFVWRRGAHWLIGRIWSSSDGKGRTRYPMVVCSQYTGGNVIEALRRIFDALGELERECKLASSAEAVRALLSRYTESLSGAVGSGSQLAPGPDAESWLKEIQSKAGDEAMLRVVYQMQTQMSAYASGNAPVSSRSSIEGSRPQQVRVPAVPELLLDSVLSWMRLFSGFSGRHVPILITAPIGESWMDVTLGQPGEEEFFCLRASPKSLPSASEIPYNLDDSFRGQAQASIEAFKQLDPNSLSVDAFPQPIGQPIAQGWLKNKFFGSS